MKSLEPTALELIAEAKKIKQAEMKNGECVGCLMKAYQKLQEKNNTPGG